MDIEAKESPSATASHANPTRFYRQRQRISLCLLLFVVIVGLPIVGVPSLRYRLSMRIMAIKAAAAGDRRPAFMDVGANKEPIPVEYQRPEPVIPRPPVLPSPERIFTMDSSVTRSGGSARATIVPKPAKSAGKIVDLNAPVEEAASERASTPPEVTEVQYQRGKDEQVAYDLLLKLNPAVMDLIQGKNTNLKFKSWDAAKRGEDSYWVRLKFQLEGNAEAEYIWVVKPQANQVSPLNFNARSISS